MAKKKSQTVKKSKAKPSGVDREHLHFNYRCRSCLIVDGYSQEEENCRYCGAKLFKGDVF